MKNKIAYDGRTFTPTDIESGGIHLAASLPSQKLEANTFSATVMSDDTTLTNFTRNAPLYYYHKDRLVCITYVQTVDRVGPNKYKFRGTSAIGRLIEQNHAGGIYTGQTAEEVIADICGSVPFEVKSALKGVKLYGWLPYASPPQRSARDNLSQVLFAIGATVKTDLDGVLRIEGLWDGISGSAGRDRMYTGASTDYGGVVTRVIVTEHQYIPGAEEKQLFEGTAQAGDIITFDEPVHSLTATGFSILDSGANWARVSAGTGTLTGKAYIHNTRQVSRDVQRAAAPNVKTVENATLVSLVNSAAVAQRLADYYRCRERVDAAVVYGRETPGDRLAVYHPFDKTGVYACLESADITISGTLKAQEKLLVGYVPPQAEKIEYFDHRELFVADAIFTVPDDVNSIRLVQIGGGDGGQSGANGTAGTSGGTARLTGNSGSNYGNAGTSGKGGLSGAGGSGGKVNVVDLEVEPDDQLYISIGAGGESGAPGGNTTVYIYRQGSLVETLSSSDGAASPLGYTDTVTGDVYATSGANGVAGADGGAAGSIDSAAQNGGTVDEYSGGAGRTAPGGIVTDTNTGPEVYQGYTQGLPQVSTESFGVPVRGYPGYTIDGEGLIKKSGSLTTIGPVNGNIVEGTVYTTSGKDGGWLESDTAIYKYTATKYSNTTTSYQLKTERTPIHRNYKRGKTTTTTGILPSGGGGAAFGQFGGNAGVTVAGAGASATEPAVQTVPGGGGNGGHGGGGGGAGGGGAVELSKATSSDYPDYSVTGKRAGAAGGNAGSGSPGGRGCNGCAILYFGEPHIINSGQLVTSDRKFFFDRLGRIFVV